MSIKRKPQSSSFATKKVKLEKKEMKLQIKPRWSPKDIGTDIVSHFDTNGDLVCFIDGYDKVINFDVYGKNLFRVTDSEANLTSIVNNHVYYSHFSNIIKIYSKDGKFVSQMMVGGVVQQLVCNESFVLVGGDEGGLLKYSMDGRLLQTKNLGAFDDGKNLGAFDVGLTEKFIYTCSQTGVVTIFSHDFEKIRKFAAHTNTVTMDDNYAYVAHGVNRVYIHGLDGRVITKLTYEFESVEALKVCSHKKKLYVLQNSLESLMSVVSIK
jgi:hypothetical protein